MGSDKLPVSYGFIRAFTLKGGTVDTAPSPNSHRPDRSPMTISVDSRERVSISILGQERCHRPFPLPPKPESLSASYGG